MNLFARRVSLRQRARYVDSGAARGRNLPTTGKTALDRGQTDHVTILGKQNPDPYPDHLDFQFPTRYGHDPQVYEKSSRGLVGSKARLFKARVMTNRRTRPTAVLFSPEGSVKMCSVRKSFSTQLLTVIFTNAQ